MKNLAPQALNGGVFDVISYGADPTGTNDSQPAFQAAANAAVAYVASSGGRAVMMVNPGKYKLNSTFRIIGGWVTVEAYGAYIFAGSNADLFRDWSSQDSSFTLNGTGLQILGGTWDCRGQNWGLQSNATSNASGFSAFTISNSSQVKFRDVIVRNIYNYHGIDINTCADVMVDNCRFEGFQNNFTWHTDCRIASTANLGLTGLSAIDGVTPIAGDRILAKNQTTTTQNGIYVAAAGAWARATDMDAATEALNAAVLVTAGTAGAGTSWYVSSNNPTPGSAAMLWSQTTGFNTQSRYFSEAVQIDNGPNAIACKNITVTNSYMGPAIDGSGLGSFGKMAGTHTDASGQLYVGMKFIGNTSVGSNSNAFSGYSYSDSTIAHNTIIGAEERGIRMFFASANSGPRLTISNNIIRDTKYHGIEIDGGASQVFNDVSITGNTIYSTVMNQGANSTGIRVDTCNRAVVSDNEICLSSSPSSNQGIFLTTVNDGMCANNVIYDVGTQGIQLTSSSRTTLTGNRVYTCGKDGIYVTASTTKCIISNNHIIGASRTTNAGFGGITLSNSANTGNVFTGNRVEKFGSGNEAVAPFKCEGTSTGANEFNNNTFNSDWGTNSWALNWALNSNTVQNFTGSDGLNATRLAADVTGLTATSFTAVTGLSATLPTAGKYRFKAFILYAMPNNGTGTATFGVTGPSATACSYTTNVQSSVTASSSMTSGAYGQNTTQSAAVTQTTVFGALIDGWAEVSATGTLQVTYKAGGTTPSITVKAATELIVEKVG